MNVFKRASWSPFVVGALIGSLTVLSYYIFGNFIGVSSGFVVLTSWLEGVCLADYVKNSLYFSLMHAGIKDYFQFALVIGIFLGSSASAWLSGSFIKNQVPTIWQNNFGSSFLLRALVAFIGGVLIIYGARMAGGCTSGKAIGSGLQLLVHAWIFIATLFVAGIVTARLLYRK